MLCQFIHKNKISHQNLLDEISKKIEALRNSETDYDRVYKRVIKDLQDGYLGKVTFDKIKV